MLLSYKWDRVGLGWVGLDGSLCGATIRASLRDAKNCIHLTFSEKFLVFLVSLVVFLGVKFVFRKSCPCKRNDKLKVWTD